MKIAVLGYGTVGSGVVEVLSRNHDNIAKRAREEISVKYVLDLREFPGSTIEQVLVHDFQKIVSDPEVKVVVETMGGVEPAYTYVKSSLLAGKSVCTSNKELVARHGAELLEIARQNNINFLFEASVGGGIPIIRPLNQSLTADEIEEITGILNGTTNYILTEMRDKGIDFDTALKEAQAKGYAERNPAADVEGFDTCRKIAILTSLAYGMQVQFEEIATEGITKITDVDIRYADALGAAIKLFGSSKKLDEKVYAIVAPKMIRPNHPLYSVNGVFNAILVRGNVLGDVMFYGSGAGKLPTASAVVSDVIDATKHQHVNIMQIWGSKKLELADNSTMKDKFFLRVPMAKRAEAEKTFKVEECVTLGGIEDEFAFVTGAVTEADIKANVDKLEIISYIRAEF